MELSTNPIIRFIERAGQKILNPILIFIYFFVFAFILTAVIGGLTFETTAADGSTIIHTIKNMAYSGVILVFMRKYKPS